LLFLELTETFADLQAVRIWKSSTLDIRW